MAKRLRPVGAGNVCFTPNSGRVAGLPKMSAKCQKQTWTPMEECAKWLFFRR